MLLSLNLSQNMNSITKYFDSLDYQCPSIKCNDKIYNELSQNIYFHMTVAGTHIEAPILLSQKLCSIIQLCIPEDHIYLIVHQPGNVESKTETDNKYNKNDKKDKFKKRNTVIMNQIIEIIRESGISDDHVIIWTGIFDANEKMKHSYNQLTKFKSQNKFIYHTDLDEFPENTTFLQALEEMFTTGCDAIHATWTDRLSLDGSLHKMNSNTSVMVQFPLRCQMSEQFVGYSYTSKTIAYRSVYRVDGGQHHVWCDRDGRTRNEKLEMIQQGSVSSEIDYKDPYWNRERACSQHIRDRNKHKDMDFISSHLTAATTRPKYCKTNVLLDHYKWTYGLASYLYQRAISYKKKGLHWWRDSRDILLHLRHHNGSLCVKCKEPVCKIAKTNQALDYDDNLVFYSRKDHYGQKDKNKHKSKSGKGKKITKSTASSSK